jgi:hypothetical protein
MHTNNDKTVLLAAIAILFKDGKPVTLKEYAGTSEGEAFKTKRTEYNDAKETYHKAVNASKDERTERTRHRASLINPVKHRVISSSGFAAGSIMDTLCEDERREKGKRFTDAIQKDAMLLPSQVGLTDAEFCQLAKAGNWIDRSFMKENSSGNLVFTAESNKEYLAKWTLDCLAFHAVKQEQSNPKGWDKVDTDTPDSVPVKPKKNKAA